MSSPLFPQPPDDTIADPQFVLRVARARHDLHNSVGHIQGFSEMWLEEVQGPGQDDLRAGLTLILTTAREMIARGADSLQVSAIQSGRADPVALQENLCAGVSRILAEVSALAGSSSALANDLLKGDLARIGAAARKTQEMAQTVLPSLILLRNYKPEPAPTPAIAGSAAASARLETDGLAPIRREGLILVVDDLEENRELLSRRLSRLGYSVRLISNGEEALRFIEDNSVDLILLDILMPGLDGFEVLQRLRADPLSQHIPVIMLSSEDQTDTVVRCITLGADDFLPKPFNATLLLARIESSLSKKRMRDQETAFVKRLQAEQDISERLLLNILPRRVAERLKLGEKNIADSFPQVTVLLTDFVNFTELASQVAPKVLVRGLNEIFSAFDQICEQHGLEKIKMIGDAYMAVGGLANPSGNHAAAAADVALAMQQQAAGFTLGGGAPCRMRIGINSGPVVAGVIGTKKFAYDLWGDAVNLASRMETHAPPGGILVTDQTYALLRSAYAFKPGRVIRVKGKGEVLTYLLLGKA